MAEKFKYATAKKFTEGHTEVLGDQSESATPTPAAEDPKMLARYAQQREMNRRKESMPFNEWNQTSGNFDRHAQDNSFKARLSRWESKQGNQGNDIHGGGGPKPVYLGKDRGGNEYQEYNPSGGRNQNGGASTGTGTSPSNRVNQNIWKDGRDGSPLSRKDLMRDKREAGALTKREKADQYSAQQPYARNELKTGIKGNFGTLGNFFNEDD